MKRIPICDGCGQPLPAISKRKRLCDRCRDRRRDQIRNYHLFYYQQHRAKILAQAQAYLREHPEKARQYQAKYRSTEHYKTKQRKYDTMRTNKRHHAYVFDMDDTLIHCDAETDKSHNYLILNIEKELPLMEYFRALRDAGKPVYILTTRHPDVKPQITSYFGIPADFVICRDFALSMAEMTAIIASEELTEKFLAAMVVYKSTRLEELAKKYAKVDFFDDMYEKFEVEHPRIRVMPPERPILA